MTNCNSVRDARRPAASERREKPELAALREAELRYRMVADLAYDWQYWEEPDGSFRYVSPSCERITGYPAERFIDDPSLLERLILPLDRETWAEHHHRAQGRGLREVQFRIRGRDGRVRWIEHVCQPVTDEQGAFRGYRASNSDITERKRVEDELHRYRVRLEELVAERTAELAEVNRSLEQEIIERARAEGETRHRLAIEEAIAQASRLFVSPAGVEADIGEVLKTLGQAVSASRAYLFQFRDNNSKMDNTHEWCDRETEPQIDNLQNLDSARFPWWMARLERGESIAVGGVGALPANAAAERDLLQAQGVCSCLVVPVELPAGTLVGFIGFGDAVKYRQWPAEDVRALRVVAEMVGVYWDRRQAEEVLRESEAKSRNIAEQSPNMIFINQKGKVVYANRRCEEVMGYTKDELCSPDFDFLKLVAPECRDLVQEHFAKHMEDEEVYPSEYSLLTKGDKRLEAIIALKTIRYHGEPAILCIVTDITERKRAEQELRKLSRAIEQSPSIVLITDTHGNIEYANPAFTRITGYTAEEALGKNARLVKSGVQPSEVYRALWGTILAGQEWRGEFVNRRKDGGLYWELASISPVKNEEGVATHFVKLAEDITKRKRVEEALREAKESAEAARLEEQKRRQEAERRHQIAESLGDVVAALNSNQPLDKVLAFITEQAGRLLDTRGATIYCLEGEAGTLAVMATDGSTGSRASVTGMTHGREALRQAVAYHHPVAVPDLAAAMATDGDATLDSRSQLRGTIGSSVYRALLAVPFEVRGETYGVMAFHYAEPRAISDEDVELAVIFANHVALAIENSQLRDLVERAAATAERGRLARELHDAVTQTLFSASLIAEAMPRIWEHSPEEGRRGLEELRQLTRGAAAEMRTMLLELRPAALTERPVGELLRHLTEAMTGRTRVPIALTVEGDCTLPPDVQIVFYRIAQEALNNVAKHAGASQASVDLRCQREEVALYICDDGSGFVPNDVLPDQLGLQIMRERAEGVGAMLEVNSQPGQGTQTVVKWRKPRGLGSDG